MALSKLFSFPPPMTEMTPEEQAEKIQLALIRLGIDLDGALTASEEVIAAELKAAEARGMRRAAEMVPDACDVCRIAAETIRAEADELEKAQ